jgi:hypothetical protein
LESVTTVVVATDTIPDIMSRMVVLTFATTIGVAMGKTSGSWVMIMGAEVEGM